MLTWGFEAEAERMATAAYKKKMNSSSNDNTSSSSEGDTTDDEYFKLLAGGGDDDTDEEEAPWMKELRESFESADINHVSSFCVCILFFVPFHIMVRSGKRRNHPLIPKFCLCACERHMTGRKSITARNDSNDVEAASTTFAGNDRSH